VPCTGAVVPHVKAGVGAIATQSYTNVRLGIDGLKLLELGLSPEAALTSLLAEDEGRGVRQCAGIDARGRVFAYSGDKCVDWYGYRTGENYSVQGNMLVGKETIDAMALAFESARDHLSSRLLKALEAGRPPAATSVAASRRRWWLRPSAMTTARLMYGWTCTATPSPSCAASST
jgi:uncharacterized Ntn-hydrolase superfamily protein